MTQSNAYKASDFVHVVDGLSGEVLKDPVPKSWLDTDLLTPGTKKATAKQISDSGVDVVQATDLNPVFGSSVAPVTGGADDGDAPAAPLTEGYVDATVKALDAEIARRNDGREDDAKISTSGNKDAKVAALMADDATSSSSGSGE